MSIIKIEINEMEISKKTKQMSQKVKCLINLAQKIFTKLKKADTNTPK